MKATEILSEEHRIILKVLDCLQRIAAQAQDQGRLNRESALEAIRFLREFADRCHHAKEEDRLFIAMQEQGFPSQEGPIGVMLMEHDSGRRLVGAMEACLPGAAEGESEAIEAFARCAGEFCALLKAHIQKEDQILFPMADGVLGGDSAQSLLAGFQEIEARAGGGRHAEFLGLANGLCRKYGVALLDQSLIPNVRSEWLDQGVSRRGAETQRAADRRD